MAYQAEYQEVDLPLIINNCYVQDLVCDVVLQEDYSDFLVTEIRIGSYVATAGTNRADVLVLKVTDKENQDLFTALSKQAYETLSEKYWEDYKEAA